MNSTPQKPHDQPETEFHGELQEFSGPALAPDDPCLGPRERKGRPGSKGTIATTEKTDSDDEQP
jgi:hypothetical protein